MCDETKVSEMCNEGQNYRHTWRKCCFCNTNIHSLPCKSLVQRWKYLTEYSFLLPTFHSRFLLRLTQALNSITALLKPSPRLTSSRDIVGLHKIWSFLVHTGCRLSLEGIVGCIWWLDFIPTRMGKWQHRSVVYQLTLVFMYFIFLVYALAFSIPTWLGGDDNSVLFLFGLWAKCLRTHDSGDFKNCEKFAFGDFAGE